MKQSNKNTQLKTYYYIVICRLISRRSNLSMECFIGAIDIGDVDYVKKYLEENKIHTGCLENALERSSRSGHLEVVKCILKVYQADFFYDNEYLLRYSALNGHLNVVKYLVENFDINREDALRWSAQNGHFKVVEYLISTGVNVNIDNNYPLISAAGNGHLSLVKYLVSKGADVHAKDDRPLRWSAYNGQLHVVKYLVEEHNANIHADNEYALRYSAENGHLNVVKYLVSLGANIHAEDEHGLKWSADKGHLHVVKYLVEECQADIHAHDDAAIRWSISRGHLQVVEYLVSRGANIMAKNGEALVLAARNGYLKLVKYLLSVRIPMDKFGTSFLTKCIHEDLPEDAEFIAQFFSKPIPENLVPIKFHQYALKYGIIYGGSGYEPMEEEYKKRKEIRSILKNEIYEKAQEILYRPGGIRSQLLEERFNENASMYLV